jgi:hypothetical protein
LEVLDASNSLLHTLDISYNDASYSHLIYLDDISYAATGHLVLTPKSYNPNTGSIYFGTSSSIPYKSSTVPIILDITETSDLLQFSVFTEVLLDRVGRFIEVRLDSGYVDAHIETVTGHVNGLTISTDTLQNGVIRYQFTITKEYIINNSSADASFTFTRPFELMFANDVGVGFRRADALSI